MTDISRYKNVSLTKDTYQNLDKIRRVITPHIVQSRSGEINDPKDNVIIHSGGVHKLH